MPLDTSIALSGKPVKFDGKGLVNLIQQGQARQMALEQHAQESELNRQRIEQGELQAEQARRVAKDQGLIREAYVQSGGDPKATVQEAIRRGVGPDSAQALEKHFADIESKYATTEASALPVRKYRNEQMLGLIGQALELSANPEQFQAAWPQLHAAAVRIDPETAKHLDPGTLPTADQLRLAQAAHATDAYYLSRAEEQR
ncbi:MAG: hypothetical protein IT514_16235, partial [Burkholderiales bacterium]|nr:hypothetical protein [Burkholderiales bacterium]